MTQPFFAPEMTVHPSASPSDQRRSLQYLFDDIFLGEPAAQTAAQTCEPFNNDTSAPTGQTMREAPKSTAPPRPTLHLPTRRSTDSRVVTNAKT